MSNGLRLGLLDARLGRAGTPAGVMCPVSSEMETRRNGMENLAMECKLSIEDISATLVATERLHKSQSFWERDHHWHRWHHPGE
mmetsp:Transcript_11609/g.20915  ORF Transcript_11609/g.20915 Transcript_11609/m.20915 type:complete len:84 (-) Transcript_11609:372-623(-)